MTTYATEACRACCERVAHERPACDELCEEALAELAEDEGPQDLFRPPADATDEDGEDR